MAARERFAYTVRPGRSINVARRAAELSTLIWLARYSKDGEEAVQMSGGAGLGCQALLRACLWAMIHSLLKCNMLCS